METVVPGEEVREVKVDVNFERVGKVERIPSPPFSMFHNVES